MDAGKVSVPKLRPPSVERSKPIRVPPASLQATLTEPSGPMAMTDPWVLAPSETLTDEPHFLPPSVDLFR